MRDKDCLRIGYDWKKMGLGLCCLAVFVVCFHILDNNLPTRDAAGFPGVVMFSLTFLSLMAGIIVLASSVIKTYKIDKKGITVYYFRIIDIFTPWRDFIYLGIEKDILLYIVAAKSNGEYALRIPCYDETLFDKILFYKPDDVEVRIEIPSASEKKIREPDADILLKDTPGKIVIDNRKEYKQKKKEVIQIMIFLSVLLALMALITFLSHDSWDVVIFELLLVAAILVIAPFEVNVACGREITIRREGIETLSYITHRRHFVCWNEFKWIGVKYGWDKNEGHYFIIKCCGSWWDLNRKILINYTPELYEQFLAYVPEGLVTDPPTQRFQMEWMKWGKKK